MKRLLPIILIALTACAKEEPKVDWPQVYLSNEWVVSEEVTFADTHDPSVIKLEDGRRLSVLYAAQLTAAPTPVGLRPPSVGPASIAIQIQPITSSQTNTRGGSKT